MKELNDLTADKFIANNECVCLLFYVEWSPDSEDMDISCDELQLNFSNVRFGRINLEECVEMPTEFKANTAPTLILLRNKQVVAKFEGFLCQDEIHDALAELRKTR